jgi:phosphoserine phosphatase RsbU/P
VDFETAAGELLLVIANAARRRDADGGLLFTALVVIKAADRRRHESQMVDSSRSFRKGLLPSGTAELREQFIALLGHYLRSPLAGHRIREGSERSGRPLFGKK